MDKKGVLKDDNMDAAIASLKGIEEETAEVILDIPKTIEQGLKEGGLFLPYEKEKISQKLKQRETTWNKPVLQFDKQGNFIKEWVGRTEAKKWLGPGDIAGCLSGKQKQKSPKYCTI